MHKPMFGMKLHFMVLVSASIVIGTEAYGQSGESKVEVRLPSTISVAMPHVPTWTQVEIINNGNGPVEYLQAGFGERLFFELKKGLASGVSMRGVTPSFYWGQEVYKKVPPNEQAAEPILLDDYVGFLSEGEYVFQVSLQVKVRSNANENRPKPVRLEQSVKISVGKFDSKEFARILGNLASDCRSRDYEKATMAARSLSTIQDKMAGTFILSVIGEGKSNSDVLRTLLPQLARFPETEGAFEVSLRYLDNKDLSIRLQSILVLSGISITQEKKQKVIEMFKQRLPKEEDEALKEMLQDKIAKLEKTL